MKPIIVRHSNIPPVFPLPWAEEWGQDLYGLWQAFLCKGVRQCMRWIPPGRFLMGSPETEQERYDNEIQHEVILTDGFWLADTTCTQELWEAVMGENPSHFKGPQRPVERVSWENCLTFFQKIKQFVPDLELTLPTEAQWEYACRAGTTTPFSFGKNITPYVVNYNGNYPYIGGKKGKYRKQTVEVTELPCNQWGLYQMHGNVWEWCLDWYDAYNTACIVNPTGPDNGGPRVCRGGGWFYDGGFVRSANRFRGAPDSRLNFLGARFSIKDGS